MPVMYARVTYYAAQGSIVHQALLDTGSTYSLIPQALCESISSQLTGREVSLQTANGTIYAPLVRIKISVNGSPPTDIVAACIPSGVYTLSADVIQKFRLFG